MLRSMTAFGRGKSSRKLGRISAEITSLNRKHLEIKISLPRGLYHLEPELRGWLTPHIGRGSVHIRITAEWVGKPPFALGLNTSFIKHYVDEGKRFEYEAGYQLPQGFWVEWALGQEGALHEEHDVDESELIRLLEEAVQDALVPFSEMKLKEGKNLAADFSKRLAYLKQEAADLGVALAGFLPKMQQKMKEFLAPYFTDAQEMEERVLREVALIAKNGDYTEELIRLKSHIGQVEKLISSEEMQVGKTMEFLLQEMNREVNTIGAKAQDLEVSKRVVDIKSELEKIREQIQNVE